MFVMNMACDFSFSFFLQVSPVPTGLFDSLMLVWFCGNNLGIESNLFFFTRELGFLAQSTNFINKCGKHMLDS